MAASRKYPLELRERAVRLYRTAEPKPQIKRLAIELGVHPEALRSWIRQTEADRGERDDRLTSAEKEELAKLRAENKELRRANEQYTSIKLTTRLVRAGIEASMGSIGDSYEVSRRWEFHPPPLSEPCVNLATHTAPIVEPVGNAPCFQ
ncbi:transposase [Streptomyces sp. NBC_01619]|uniref:transposase n=1 Tax=Streptomyces sp. NBC_01619 TaxID=2975901 RepID=UPI002259E289|nr:transposase [Streptomyces sp. NBC_01619]MCX4516031.1 transposase [Streptomyces sp. NBC_01619]